MITEQEKVAATERFNKNIAELHAQGKMWCSLCDKIKSLSEFDDDFVHNCRECLAAMTPVTDEELRIEDNLLSACMLAERFIVNYGRLVGDGTPTGFVFCDMGNKLRFAIAEAHGFHDADIPDSALDKVERLGPETDADVCQRELQALQVMEDLMDRLNERSLLFDVPDNLNESVEVVAKIKHVQQDEEDRNEMNNLIYNCTQRRK